MVCLTFQWCLNDVSWLYHHSHVPSRCSNQAKEAGVTFTQVVTQSSKSDLGPVPLTWRWTCLNIHLKWPWVSPKPTGVTIATISWPTCTFFLESVDFRDGLCMSGKHTHDEVAEKSLQQVKNRYYLMLFPGFPLCFAIPIAATRRRSLQQHLRRGHFRRNNRNHHRRRHYYDHVWWIYIYIHIRIYIYLCM